MEIKMANKKIKDIPRFRKVNDEIDSLTNFRRLWPYIKPILTIFGVNSKVIEEQLSKLDEISKEAIELMNLPDEFNNVFSEQGWICFELLSIDTMKKAIQIAKNQNISVAEQYLVDYFSPEWVYKALIYLNAIKNFSLRYPLIQKAYQDYAEGRYYSTILVLLSQIDGIVNDLNKSDFQRSGFFSEKSHLIAWDSITANENGLARLQNILSKRRLLTRTEQITVPYRNGIMHGTDLGYDNKIVAAKCWCTLFAVRDWAIKAQNNEILPPLEEPEKEKTLLEIIEEYNNVSIMKDKLLHWKPREFIDDQELQTNISIEGYNEGTPEQKLNEFLNYWMKKNYGYMSNCFYPKYERNPKWVRDNLGKFNLISFNICKIKDVLPYITDIEVELDLLNKDLESPQYMIFRLIRINPDGSIADFYYEDKPWTISHWDHKKEI